MAKLRKLLISVSGILLLFLAIAYWSSHQRHLENEKLAQSLLAQIAAAPDDPRLKTNICALLDTGDLSVSNGNLLLKALVSQRVTQRDTYLAGRRVYAKFVIGDPPSIDSYAFGYHVKGMAGTECLGKVEGIVYSEGADCEFYRAVNSQGKVVSTEAAGEYDGSIVIDYTLYKRGRRQWYWPSYGQFPKNLLPRRERLGLFTDTVAYECEITVPVHFRVVATPETEWTASSELDEKVKRAFSLDSTGWLKAQQQPPRRGIAIPQAVFRKTGETNTLSRYPNALNLSQDMDCDMELWVSNAPVNLAFVTSFRDASGVDHPSKTLRIVVKKSKKWSYILQQATDDFGLPPGHYKGDLILKADKSVAYDSLEIKDIWNGTLSFPVDFVIKPKPAK